MKTRSSDNKNKLKKIKKSHVSKRFLFYPMRYGNHITAEAFNWNLHGRPISLASISLDILENECFDETEF